MDPISLIVSALATGATVVAQDVATKAIRDAYDGFKALIISRFGAKGAVAASIEQIEQNPTSAVWQNALKDGLQQTGAAADAQVVDQARALLDLIAQLSQSAGSTTSATLTGSGAIAQNDSVAAGEGGIAVQGDVHGPIIHGSRNIVGDIGGDVDMSDRRTRQSGKYNVHIEHAEDVTIGDQGQPDQSAALDPAVEQEILQEQLQAQKLLLATYHKQLILASGGEAARLQVLIQQTEDEIRRLELRLDDLQTGA